LYFLKIYIEYNYIYRVLLSRGAWMSGRSGIRGIRGIGGHVRFWLMSGQLAGIGGHVPGSLLGAIPFAR
jgi:hypothetical protein